MPAYTTVQYVPFQAPDCWDNFSSCFNRPSLLAEARRVGVEHFHQYLDKRTNFQCRIKLRGVYDDFYHRYHYTLNRVKIRFQIIFTTTGEDIYCTVWKIASVVIGIKSNNFAIISLIL